MNAKEKITKGQIYCHIDGLSYEIVAMGIDVTGYEKSRKVGGEKVIYKQLEDGKYPTGTIWTRDIVNFFETVHRKGKIVQIFTPE